MASPKKPRLRQRKAHYALAGIGPAAHTLFNNRPIDTIDRAEFQLQRLTRSGPAFRIRAFPSFNFSTPTGASRYELVSKKVRPGNAPPLNIRALSKIVNAICHEG